MSNPYRHPISTPVPELQGIASIAAPDKALMRDAAVGIGDVDEDWLTDVIDDSLDMDWTGRVGAQAIIRELAKLREAQIERQVCHVCGARGRSDHAGYCSESI